MSKPLSKRQVNCAECGKTFKRFENLQRHFESSHPGKPCMQKNQSSLLDLMRAGSKRALPPDDANENAGSQPNTQEEENPPTVADSGESGPEDFAPPLASTSSALVTTSQPNPAFQGEPVGKSDQSLFDQIQQVLAQWSPSHSSVSSYPTRPTPLIQPEISNSGVEERVSQIKVQITACRSLKDFENVLDDSFQLDRDSEKLECLVCKSSTKPVVFQVSGVEVDRLPTKSRKLRNLQSHLVAHLSTDHHGKQEAISQKAQEEKKKNRQRNKDIGRTLGSLAYFIFHNQIPFQFFEKILPWMALVKIDIGQINHSERFVRTLLSPCFNELKKRLQQHLNKPLPCTGELRPLNLAADKGTVKHDCNQVTMIRTVALKNGHLFERFFIGHPDVLSHKGRDISSLLLSCCSENLNLSLEEIRQRISGGCFDGQYLHLNVPRHLSEMLQLPLDFFEDSIIWDAAHRLELANDNVKNGKKDSQGNWVIQKTPWLQELDSVLQTIMTKFRLGKNHSDLRKIAKEKGESFLEFCIFSETRFIEYAHRTYNHFIRMFHILFEKIKQDEASSDSNKETQNLEELEKLLVQAKTVCDLLFMNEVSQLMTFCSKSFQKFDTLPFETMHAYEHLTHHLIQAKESLSKLTAPKPIKIIFPNSQTYTVWELFGTSIRGICNTQTFHDVSLLVPGDRGRVTRSGQPYGYDKDAFTALVHSRFQKYEKYLVELLASLRQRYEPWPKWLLMSDDCFNFAKELTQVERQSSLKALMECPTGPIPLLPEEKTRISAEYVTFILNAEKAAALQEENGQVQLWYELLTNETYYKHCQKFIAFALLFLNRSFNEAIVEVEVSSLKNISTEKRPLLQKTTEMLNFISRNGPHPLVSLSLVDDFLDAHFGKDWHFTLNESKWFVSKTVDRHFKLAKQLPNSLA